MQNSEERTRSQALAVFLFWLKTGNRQEMIATHFSTISKQDESCYCEQVREALATYFVPEHLGAHAKTRDQWLQHRTLISNELFDAHDGKLLLAAEGTFCFCEKSANNSYQRQQPKRRASGQTFAVVTPDGCLVDLFGIYEAHDNDAKILLHIFQNEEEFRDSIKPGKIVI